MRVIRESKIIMELLYVLGTVNIRSSYLFDCHGGAYSLKNNLSVPTLSPVSSTSLRLHVFTASTYCW